MFPWRLAWGTVLQRCGCGVPLGGAHFTLSNGPCSEIRRHGPPHGAAKQDITAFTLKAVVSQRIFLQTVHSHEARSVVACTTGNVDGHTTYKTGMAIAVDCRHVLATLLPPQHTQSLSSYTWVARYRPGSRIDTPAAMGSSRLRGSQRSFAHVHVHAPRCIRPRVLAARLRDCGQTGTYLAPSTLPISSRETPCVRRTVPPAYYRWGARAAG